MKDMKDTGKAKKHGKLQMMGVMMMGTVKENNSGKINKGLRRERGTMGKIHSKDGVRRQARQLVHRRPVRQ